jgi:hypothetical protein
MTNIRTKRPTARKTFVILAVCSGVLGITGPTTSHAAGPKPGVNIDVNYDQIMGDVKNALDNFGIVPSGTTKEIYGALCIMNNWADRDGRASAEGMFDHRFSQGTQLGGRWYCYIRPR